MTIKFVVSYEIDYVHRVSVGIEAENRLQALHTADQAFNAGLLWDDTEEMPLLSDDFYESDLQCMIWECEQVAEFPNTDSSVIQLKQEQAAMRVCRGLIEVYQQAEAFGESIDLDDLDVIVRWAAFALGRTPEVKTAVVA
jgi:hypothetical protein